MLTPEDRADILALVRSEIAAAATPRPYRRKAPPRVDASADIVPALLEGIDAVGRNGEVTALALLTALASDPLALPLLRAALAARLPQLKGRLPTVGALGALLGRAARLAPSPGLGRIAYRHVGTGGLWRVDAA